MLFIQIAGKIAWRREEALAYVLSVEMIDLPVSENQAKYEDEFGSHKGRSPKVKAILSSNGSW